MKEREQEMHHVAGRASRGQPGPRVVGTQRGVAFDGGSFYVWDEDRLIAVSWANQLAAASSCTPRWIPDNHPPGAAGLSRKEPAK